MDQVLLPLDRSPLGMFRLAAPMAIRTSSRARPWALSRVGFTSTRTAGRAPPHTKTWPTPWICDSFCCSTEEAMSYMRSLGMIFEVSARSMIGESAGFTLRYEGLFGRLAGRLPWAELISVMPAMRPNWRSRGVATEEAMVSGLAPGRPADTWMVGNSTWGRGATGRN